MGTAPNPEQASARRLVRVVALIGVDLAAVASLLALFADPAPWPLLASIVVTVHLVAAVFRFVRVPLFVSTVVTFAASVVLVSRELFGPTMHLGVIPTGLTVDLARTALVEARSTYGAVVAPVSPLAGFVLLAAAATWVVAATSDLVAFPGAARLEALVPGAAMVLFSAALGPDDRSTGSLILFAVASVICVAASRVDELEADPWLDDPSLASRLRTVGAAAVALLAVVGSVGIGRQAADERVGDGSIDWRSGRERNVERERADRDPMVTVRSRLVDQSDREMFRARPVVSGPRFDLWRQRTLEQFDGTNWSAAATPDPAATAGGEPTAEVEVTVGALRGTSIPIPGYVLAVLDGDGADTNLAGIDTRSEDAVAPNGLRSDDRWRVRWQGRPTLSSLGDARTPELFTLTSRERGRLTTVPLSDAEQATLRAVAAQVTAGAADEVEQAAMLNRFFLTQFRYDLDVARTGDGATSIVQFVTETRRGYCEQFASAYAAMARLLGLPARVVVGFARGVPQADGGEIVEGRHAHAWAEVFVPGTPGWVTVDPTPGQGLNSSDPRPVDLAPTTLPPPTTAAPATVAPPTTAATTPEALPPSADAGTGMPQALRIGALVVMLSGLLAGLVAAARWAIRFARGPRGPGAEEQAERAWERLEDVLSWVASRRRTDESPVAFARRCRRDGVLADGDADDLLRIARELSAVRYGPMRSDGRLGSDGLVGSDPLVALPVRMAALEHRITTGLPRVTRAVRAVAPVPRRRRTGGHISADDAADHDPPERSGGPARPTGHRRDGDDRDDSQVSDVSDGASAGVGAAGPGQPPARIP